MSLLLEQVLVEAINDEYRARATYNRVIREFGKVRPFVNIVGAEGRHIQALRTLFAKYGLEVPKDTWDTRVQTPGSLQEACQAGVQGEIENGTMYDRLLPATMEYPDVQQVLRNLQHASQSHHLPAFQRAVERYEAFDAVTASLAKAGSEDAGGYRKQSTRSYSGVSGRDGFAGSWGGGHGRDGNGGSGRHGSGCSGGGGFSGVGRGGFGGGRGRW